jgi:hypothetical protein
MIAVDIIQPDCNRLVAAVPSECQEELVSRATTVNTAVVLTPTSLAPDSIEGAGVL